MMATTLTASDIATALNTNGFEYFGNRAKAWTGGTVSRIYFGRDYVTIEADGEVHNRVSGKARAKSIGWDAVDAVEAIING